MHLIYYLIIIAQVYYYRRVNNNSEMRNTNLDSNRFLRAIVVVLCLECLVGGQGAKFIL